MGIMKWWGNLFHRRGDKGPGVLDVSTNTPQSNNSFGVYLNNVDVTGDALKLLREHDEAAHRYYLTKDGYRFLGELASGSHHKKNLEKLASIYATKVFLDILGYLGMKSDLMKEAIRTGNTKLANKLANEEPRFDESFTFADISEKVCEDADSVKASLELGIERGLIGVYYKPK